MIRNICMQALFLPSGVMAQQIALQIHFNAATGKDRAFVCHYSSHILQHEADVSSHLLNMQPVVVAAQVGVREQQPLTFGDIRNAIETSSLKPATVIVELPHREIGGKATSFADLEKISSYCRANGMALHMDGARLWEALAHYTTETTSSGEKVTKEVLCALFDSVYMSTYKGLGGMTGALLMGSAAFIAQARVWLRRYGGNVFTLLPYAVSAYSSFRNYLEWNDTTTEEVLDGSRAAVTYSMKSRLARLQHVVALLTSEFEVEAGAADRLLVRFDPPVPQVCMVHIYIRAGLENVKAAHAQSLQETGISSFFYIRAAPTLTNADGVAFPEESVMELNIVRKKHL